VTSPAESARRTNSVFASWLEQILTIVTLVLLVALGVLGWIVHDLQHDIGDAKQAQQAAADRNQETGFANRAITCRLSTALGIPVDSIGPCKEPPVLRYYDPNAAVQSRAQATSAKVLAIVCTLAAKQDVRVPECNPGP
jgi:hypothetical protein